MAKGISLHVGINQASSAFPGARKLTGPENDAREMEKIADAKGFCPRDLLLGSDATYARVTAKIRSAAYQLEDGDIFLFTFAGHGFQQANTGFDPDDQDNEDGVDETILLFDVEVFDDVFRKDLWPCFKSGVRVLIIGDCCHSGDNFLLETLVNQPVANGGDEFPVATSHQREVRAITRGTNRQHLNEYAGFYRSTLIPALSPPINASLMLLAACEPDDTTLDGYPNGMYTAAMLNVLKNSDPADYDVLVEGIHAELIKAGRIHQLPIIEVAGVDNPYFRAQSPFTI
jgi:metacaspase-1